MLSAVLGVPCPKQALCHILLGLGILEHCSDTDTSPLHVLVIFQVVFAFFFGGVDVFQELFDLCAGAVTLQQLWVIRDKDVSTKQRTREVGIQLRSSHAKLH